MRTPNTARRVLLPLLLALGAGACSQEPATTARYATLADVALAAGKVEVAVVKYAGLTEAIKKERGKVLVVDVWALY
jgi:hypothetical protein